MCPGVPHLHKSNKSLKNLVCNKNNNNDASDTINITHNVYISHNITYITN